MVEGDLREHGGRRAGKAVALDRDAATLLAWAHARSGVLGLPPESHGRTRHDASKVELSLRLRGSISG